MDWMPAATFGYPTVSWFLPIVYGSLGAIPALLSLFFDFDKTADSFKAAGDNHRKNVYDFIIGKQLLHLCIHFFVLKLCMNNFQKYQ